MKQDLKTFRTAFRKAKKEGKKSFFYKGKNFSTETAEEKAKKLSDKELGSAREKAYTDAKRSGWTQSKKEISESYTNEYQYRLGDKIQKKGLNPDKYEDRMKANFRGSAYGMRRPKRLK